MGGAQSQFHDTDWDKGDGGAVETLDGSDPTSEHVLLTLTKTNQVNQREFQVRDESGTVLYATKAVEATTKDFDLMDFANGNKLFHVQTDALRAKWEIFSYQPNFDGQAPVAELNLTPDEPLYHKALVKIAWDKYHGEVHLYEASSTDNAAGGVVAKDPIVKVEEIKSTMAAFQSFVPKLSLKHAPLCGYWVREQTANTDHVKMHLTAKTDVALHTILAVITNLVHVERQAEHCT